MQHFASQLRSEQQPTPSLRAAQYRRKRKTRLDDASNEAPASPPPGAGLLSDDEDELPAAPFPHAPARTARAHYGAAKAREDMAKLPSPLYAVNAAAVDVSGAPKDTAALRKTHLAVLSALMHRCLLAADYERAGRAWGLILRTQAMEGRTVDVRNNGRWGIGAEILLHRESTAPENHGRGQVDQSRGMESTMFSEKGFELAKEYYERLIVQYPNRKTLPNAVDERTFYPAMFSLWICDITANSRLALKQVTDQATRRSRSSRSLSIDSTSGLDDRSHHSQQDAIRLEELAQAMEVAERLDRLIVSPPFDKQASLLQLRGNVCLWIGDLVMGRMSLDEDYDMDGSTHGVDDPYPVADQRTRLANCERELKQALAFCKRAEANGAKNQAITTTGIAIKLRQVTRIFERLRNDADSGSSNFNQQW